MPSDQELIRGFIKASAGLNKCALAETACGRTMLAASPERRASIAATGIELWIREQLSDAGRVTSLLLRSNPKEWTAEGLQKVVEAAAELKREHPRFGGFQWFPHKPLISALERLADESGLTTDLRAVVERWRQALLPRALTAQEEREFGEAQRDAALEVETTPWARISAGFETLVRLERIRIPLADERKLIERLANLIARQTSGTAESPSEEIPIDASDAVGALMTSDVSRNGKASTPAWRELLVYARTLSSSKPSPRWMEKAAELANKVPRAAFNQRISAWCTAVGTPTAQALISYRQVFEPTLLNDCSVETLKGLAWAAVASGRAEVAPALANVAEACFKKIPNIGPRNVKLGNAAVAALGAFGETEAAACLARVRLRMKHPSSRAAVDKNLSVASEKTGLSAEDLSELAVPVYGLKPDGSRMDAVGDYQCEWKLGDSLKVELHWWDAAGKRVESLPSALKKKLGAKLKAEQREAREASIMLSTQSLLLEKTFVNGRTWPFQIWEERFLQHPLLRGTLARRLIWHFDDVLAVPTSDGLVTVAGKLLKPRASAKVQLWHPSHSPAEDVLAWRTWLQTHGLTQPFKQAHREIYLLTDAERRTETYSNRFAAHILKQHQLAAICQQRGWDYKLQGDFDSHNYPTLRLPGADVSAEFWVEAIENEATERGIFLYVSTDQLRFNKPLQRVEPVIFSEVMRDIDLFVGVASVANDPNWRDGIAGARLRTYWENWGFGDLSELAITRKKLLETLVPKLRIADRCSLEGKFLRIRGDLRTYKIHLGSSNVLMEPNDQYLCIVQNRTKGVSVASDKTFLPFEGDTTLALILSKAFLLAEDSRIKEQSIVRQIKS